MQQLYAEKVIRVIGHAKLHIIRMAVNFVQNIKSDNVKKEFG
jgi:hypothetical protein